MKIARLLIAAILPAFALARCATTPPADQSLPTRLHETLFSRLDRNHHEVGLDQLDPLLWYNTRHLSIGPAHEAALKLLHELSTTPPQSWPPLNRAILQHDLWAVFDWANVKLNWDNDDGRPAEAAGRKRLRAPLAKAIHHLALTREQIAALPDNYKTLTNAKTYPANFDAAAPDTPFLPPDLFDSHGPWVCIGAPRTGTVAATDHARFFDGRSAFLVFINLLEGRNATLDYLQRLSSVPNPTTRQSRDDTLRLVNDLPQFPAGTQVALVRRMLLLDSNGNITPTTITQNVQLRVYLRVRPAFHAPEDQRFFEFTLDRKSLLESRGGLRPVGTDEELQVAFNGILTNLDPFEAPEPNPYRPLAVMKSCITCHSRSGIYSVNTFSNNNAAAKPDPHLLPVTLEEETARAIQYKSDRKTFATLQTLLGSP